jgi:hypothetical protein
MRLRIARGNYKGSSQVSTFTPREGSDVYIKKPAMDGRVEGGDRCSMNAGEVGVGKRRKTEKTYSPTQFGPPERRAELGDKCPSQTITFSLVLLNATRPKD